MIRVILYLATIAASAIAEAQVTETRSVADFTEIHVSSGIQVIYTQSQNKSVVVESDNQEKLDRIVTEAKGGTLKIYVIAEKENWKKKNTFKVINVYVSAPNVKSFKTDSGAQINLENEITSTSKIEIDLNSGSSVKGNISAKNIDIDADSASSFSGRIKATTVNVDLDSASTVSVTGSAESISIEASSSAKFSGKDFTVKSADIEANSTSSVTLTVTESIKASADSLAKINYYGNPKNANKKSSSLGEVNEK
jgi:hypothetical protein